MRENVQQADGAEISCGSAELSGVCMRLLDASLTSTLGGCMKAAIVAEYRCTSEVYGGDDGARTRDLCRDRMATQLESYSYGEQRGTKRHR